MLFHSLLNQSSHGINGTTQCHWHTLIKTDLFQI